MKRCSTSLLEKCKSILQGVVSSYPSSKNLQTIYAGKDVEERKPCCTIGECKMIWPLWRTVWRLLEKSRNKITIWCMLSCFSHVQLFSILWTVARQVPLSMGIFQEGLLEWVTMPSSRGSSWLRDGTHVSCLQQWQFGSLPLVPPGKPKTIISTTRHIP